MRESRASVIAHYVNAAVKRSALTERRYATDVAALYEQRTPLHARNIPFHYSGDYLADERANAQLITRFLDGTVRLPADAEEALVLALPEPFRGDCLRELCERYGLLAAERPAVAPVGQVRQASALMRESAEAVDAIAELLADGAISADDGRAKLTHALQQLTDMDAVSVTLRQQILHALESGPAPTVTHLRRPA